MTVTDRRRSPEGPVDSPPLCHPIQVICYVICMYFFDFFPFLFCLLLKTHRFSEDVLLLKQNFQYSIFQYLSLRKLGSCKIPPTTEVCSFKDSHCILFQVFGCFIVFTFRKSPGKWKQTTRLLPPPPAQRRPAFFITV